MSFNKKNCDSPKPAQMSEKDHNRQHNSVIGNSSGKRRQANRRNAQKSTGPKTAAGKTISAQNAIKHGLLAKAPVIQGWESMEDWATLRDGFFESISPVGFLQEKLTMKLAEFS